MLDDDTTAPAPPGDDARGEEELARPAPMPVARR
jgi:hypothetical protein